jgi:ribonuclease BN (tRNA processing enzyme)
MTPREQHFTITVLGAGPAWANPGGACSGYLLRSGGSNVLLECGFGIFSRLRQQLPLAELAAVVISHLHADHFMDLVPLRYGLKYGQLRADPGLRLYVPPGGAAFFAQLGRALDGDPHFFDGTFRLSEYAPRDPLEIGTMSFEFRLVKHYIPSHAMTITSGRRLAFSGDAAPCRALVEAARESDLFVCEAAINSTEEDDPDPDHRGHLTAAEAAAVASEANAARLLLTHYRSDPITNEAALARASRIFRGPTELAVEGRSYPV